ncbi:S66 family peptidase [Chitinophaga nivalis]|uniref:LD-carboxypeptidase n=1 Tax=Chitinophaga nivalis TaxID=2991709 RepID=A0ABT3IMU4_9BACT|nr:S66 peptidase family protein [Chitinophaga nivalis]MCW3465023.1 LD-carboxypeptidase [Chitinophaga nivalis]MCW3485285.1 LD-carboxypeptidase [Chitinophaga nivalis]
MQQLIKPTVLKKGDKVATISLSWGAAGELPHRYERGKKQLEEVFGLEVVATKHALKSAEWLYHHPQARAADLMEAFADPSIKAIITNIGGEDSIRTLPYIDLRIIQENPKIFLGFSDSTITHFACLKAGLTSFYGTSLLVGFAENGGMHDYQIADLKNTLFSTQPVGQIMPHQNGWTSERLEWFDPSLSDVKRKMIPSAGWRFLQGNRKVRGRLIGGCFDVLESLKGTAYWPAKEMWRDCILFGETSEDMIDPLYFRYWLRNYAAQGILQEIQGLIIGRPYDNEHEEAYNTEILKIMAEEGLTDLPIITAMDFGHTCPTFTLPFGVMAEIDCVEQSFSIIESGVSK